MNRYSYTRLKETLCFIPIEEENHSLFFAHLQMKAALFRLGKGKENAHSVSVRPSFHSFIPSFECVLERVLGRSVRPKAIV